jgi:hypothetical protein
VNFLTFAPGSRFASAYAVMKRIHCEVSTFLLVIQTQNNITEVTKGGERPFFMLQRILVTLGGPTSHGTSLETVWRSSEVKALYGCIVPAYQRLDPL